MMWSLAENRFADWLLGEIARSRLRVHELRAKYPSAPREEQAQRLIDEKKKWAAAGGALSGLFGLATLPADVALVAWLRMSLIVDVALLCGRNLKSARAREELLDVFHAAADAAGTASRSSPSAVARLAERVLAARGFRFFGRAVPMVGAPVAAVVNHRDLQVAGEEALRFYSRIPKALGRPGNF